MLKKTMLDRIKSYINISEIDKKKIFLAATKNDIRYNNDKKQIVEFKFINDTEVDFEMVEKYLGKNNLIVDKEIRDLFNDIKELKYTVLKKTQNEVIQSIIINFVLYKNNYCPLLNFAFDIWLYKKEFSEKTFLEQIDLSTTYLYRLVKVENETFDYDKTAKGAYSYIHIDFGKGILEKEPKNLAAKLFANKDEVDTMKYLSGTDLKCNIPKLIGFDDSKGTIKKQYVHGKLGHELLMENLLDDVKIKKLKILYNNIIDIALKNNINLDIHPSNFVWNEKENQWYLIDLGLVPQIAYEYYPQNFDEYLNKIWIERLERMKKFPIRSVNI